MEIPKDVLKILKKHEGNIGREKLSELAGIGERPAQKYITIFKTLKAVNEERLGQDMNLFAESLINKLKNEKILDESKYKKPFSGKVSEEACLVLSDVHVGKRNVFYDLEKCENITTYNTSIFLEETENLLKGVHKIVDLLKTNYDIEKLNVFCVGDLIDNDLIYKGQRFFIDACAGEQLWIAVKAFTEMFTALLEIFKEIEIISIPGNHGRKAFMEAQPSANNFDYHLMKILSVVFQHNDNISFVVPNSWNYMHTIFDWKYYLHHGNDVYSWMSLPYYGITRKSTKRMSEIQFDKEIIGHFHTDMRIPISSKADTLVNGSWINRDNFAWEKFGVFSKAKQRFFGVNKKRPETWSFAIEL